MTDYRIVLLSAAGMLCLLAWASGCASAAGPAFSGISVEPQRVTRYAKAEITFHLSRTYDNPFDPEQIDVTAEIRTPSGTRIAIPAFPYQEYRSVREDDKESVEPGGELAWKVRFAPTEAGRHSVRIRAKDAQGPTTSEEIAFEAVASDSPGFIRRSTRAPRHFEFDSGKPYFALGENVCWPGQNAPLREYEMWFGHLSEARCNFARLWLAGPWIATAPIYCPDRPKEVGPGRYSQRSSWRLDRVVEIAEERGIYVMLCLDSFNSLRVSQPYPAFDEYPLNAKFGGPLESPDGFFTDPEARKLFQRRLRYYVARWGYSTNVFAWEFWNEVDIIEHYDSAQVAAWHRDMARYLRALDPWDHLITTSFARSPGDPAIDGSPEMDLVQTHCYGPRDIAGALTAWSRDKAAQYEKPHFVGEFGADGLGARDQEDKQGVHLHNGIWATALSGDAGTAMTWWWDQYIEPQNQYRHFAALARFLDGVDWLGTAYGPASIERVAFPDGAPFRAADFTVDPKVASWEQHPANEPREYRVGRDGVITDADVLSRLLHGLVNHRDKHNPPTFIVDYPADGAFEVIVSGVSGWGGANLRVRLDDETKLAAEFPDDAPDDHETMQQYDGAYRVEVPAGPHRIMVENEGTDWLYVSYRFVGYLTAPDVRVVGLANSDSALLWIQNKANTWWNALEGFEIAPLAPVCITIADLTDGEYTVEWWDTYSGAPVSTDEVNAEGGKLTIMTSEIPRDAACKVARRK
ncbi:MAG: DUF5060 domain-containing protein [Armatimonadota bacterium]|nr:MAG: DUF5060 domain-containing protein [Armatimonadota bacterium]